MHILVGKKLKASVYSSINSYNLGSNGDRLEFTYINGVKSGPATYKFSDGSIEVELYLYNF